MFSSSSSRRPKRILAIDWDQRTLRIAHAELGKRGPEVDRLLSVRVPPEVDINDPQQMGAHIKAVLDEEGIRTRHAVVDIPRDQAILNTLRLPLVSPDDLPGMVQIQIAKELPFPVTEASVDYAVPPAKDDESTGDVLVAAVRREVLEQYESTCVAAGLKLARIGLRPFANKVAICDLLGEALPQRVMFVDVGPTLAEIDVIKDGRLEFSRAASVHIPQSFEEPLRLSVVRDGDSSAGFFSRKEEPPPPNSLAAVVESLVLEVMRSLEAYRAKDHGAQIDRAIVGGDLGVEEALAEAIEKRLGIDSEIYNPAVSFGWTSEEGVAAGSFAAALGLVLGHGAEDTLHFDFLHPKEVVSRTKEKLKKAPLVAAVIALFAIAGGVVVESVTGPKRQDLAKIEKRIEELEGNAKQNKAFLKLVDRITAFDEAQYVWVDVLWDAISALPSTEALVIDEITLDQKNGRMVLKTRGKLRETGGKAVSNLMGYRRDGSDKPRFEAVMGPQSEGRPEVYRYSQNLVVQILGDKSRKTKSK